ncbi:MAG TPA: flavodoxin family protein [Rhizomicrobium sp.]|jgi:multimeric flavodoxin WrbA
MPLTAIAVNCTLKSGRKQSSTDKLLKEALAELKKEGVGGGEIIRLADFDVKPGVESDEGDGDEWPDIRKKILAADIFILGTPIWMGQPSSLAKRVIERMDAFLDETDKQDRMPSYSKVACCAIVGNEDGAHHCSAEIFQALNDVGFTIPANGMTYWVGEAMGDTNYVDLKKPYKKTVNATQMMARNAAHLAKILAAKKFPGKV